MKIWQSFALSLLLAGGLSFAKDSPYQDSKSTISGQYVRIQLPGDKRILTLNEVEVYSGGKNIAASGKATQSSIGSGGEPSRAMDGNKNPSYGGGGQTHTSESKNPWWELDLGSEKAISAIGVWNRADGLEARLNDFTIEVLDAKKKQVWHKVTVKAPSGSVHFDLPSGKHEYLTHAGKKGTEKDWKGDRSESVYWTARDDVSVPGDYRDPAEFTLQKNDTIAIIGNGLGERFQHGGELESYFQALLPEHQLAFRNMCLSGDKVGFFPRSKGFTPMNAYLQHVEADVIFCFFGYNESFDDNPSDYTKKLVDYVKTLRAYQPNGKTFPRIVLFSPIAHENIKSLNPNLPNGNANNKRLAKYTEATRTAAEQAGVTFVDIYSPSRRLYKENDAPLTLNGIHLNDLGKDLVAKEIAKALLKKDISADVEKVAAAVQDKNWHWFNRYRATDGNDVWGGRSKLKFVNDQTNAEVLQHELIMIDQMVANRDQAIWAAANGKDYTVSDGNVPGPVPVISNVGGGSKSSSAEKEGSLKYLSGEEGIEKITVPEGFEVNLYADEAMFPEMVNPVQMQVDSKGRIWAAVWPTYPKWEPLKEMKDALVILEDTDGDGVADKCKEFARVHNPLGFEFWNGGVLVTSQPDLIFLKDTDGDDVADVRE
ncbi:MAG: GDSL-type esterase/lipase family protein, partial [Verrucomicrobiota bacterium]